MELLDRIARDPDDDTARLVYADWLEDSGDADAAQLIRLQCGYSAQPPAWSDLPQVARAERCLPDLAPSDFPLAAREIGISLTYRRGLPDRATLGPGATTDHAGWRETIAALSARFPTIDLLVLADGDRPVDDGHVAAARACPTATRVSLSVCDGVTGETFDRAFTGLRLVELDLSHCSQLEPPALDALPSTLTALDVSYCELLADADLSPLARLPLTSLALRGVAHDTARLAELEGLDRLTRLSTHAELSGADLTALGRRHPALTDVVLNAGELDDRDVRRLPRWPLERLELFNAVGLGDKGVATLVDTLPDLGELELSYCEHLAPDALARLGQLPIHTLDLMGDAFDDAHLAALARWSELESLDLAFARGFGDAGLAALRDAPMLRHVRLSYDRQLTETALRALTTLPGLESLDAERAVASDAAWAALPDNAFPRLVRLRIEDAEHFTDAGAAHIPRVAPALQSLTLFHTACGDEGLARLAAMPRLHVLGCWRCPTTEEGLAALRARHPSVLIDRPPRRWLSRVEVPSRVR